MMEVVLLDFSPYGNEHDFRSDRLLQGAFEKSGVASRIELVNSDGDPGIDADLVWLRYDLRSPADLRWVISLAGMLESGGRTLFPSSDSIWKAEDKWETWLTFEKYGVRTPGTYPAVNIEQCGYPAIIKSRVGWGGKGSRILDEPSKHENVQAMLNDCFIVQRYLPHRRTLIATIAGGKGFCCLEDWGDARGIDGRMSLIDFPSGALDLALRAMKAVGGHTGTVDLIETPEGFSVLEVNLSPRILHPSAPHVDLATPMVKAVLVSGGLR